MKTKITELFGIEYPIILSPMAMLARAPLVIATCNAGGLGLLAPPGFTTEELRQQIREIKKAVNGRPFGINMMPILPNIGEIFKMVMEEEVPIWTSGLRNPFAFFNMKKPENILYIPAVGSVRQAIEVEKEGADAVIVQSLESGGHSSYIASSVLIPEVARAVKIPVVGAGGFCDGKGLAAALALGAEGIAMGTRFAVTQESPIPHELKLKYVASRDKDAAMSPHWDGMPLRAISKMKGYRGWWTRPWGLLPAVLTTKKEFNVSWKVMFENFGTFREIGCSPFQFVTGQAMFRRTLRTGNVDKSFSPCGQVVGLIRDIPTCKELVDRTVAEFEAIVTGLYTDVLNKNAPG